MALSALARVTRDWDRFFPASGILGFCESCSSFCPPKPPCVLSPEFIQLAKSFEEHRRKWQKSEHELGRYKDLLMKTEAERSALDVKLKHARNQVDVEIKRRQKAEMDCEKLVSNSCVALQLLRVWIQGDLTALISGK